MSIEANEDDDSFNEVYMKYSSFVLTYEILNKPLVRRSDSSNPLSNGISISTKFPDGQYQDDKKGGLWRPRRISPLLSISRLYEPRPGSIRLFFEMNCHLKPVTLFRPNLAPGIAVSAG